MRVRGYVLGRWCNVNVLEIPPKWSTRWNVNYISGTVSTVQ
jgi:hypothetical protein